jgi:hypothetical protein
MGTPVWKEVLLPGLLTDPKTRKRHRITARDIRQSHENVRLMLARGVPVPCVFEHIGLEAGDPDERRARFAKHCFGHIGDSRLSTEADVAALIASRPGTLLLRHDVANDEDIPKLRACKYVSPKLRPGWVDSRGHEYDGTVLTHSALTPGPVQHWQQPFSIQLSDDTALYLSYTPPGDADDSVNSSAPPIDTPRNKANSTAPCPPQTDTRDEWTFAGWLAEARRAAGLDPVELSTTDPPEGSPVADEAPKPPEKKKDDAGGGAGGKKTLADVIKALRESGMNIPDEVEDETGLVIAIKASKGGEPEPEDDLPSDAAPDTAPAPGGPPMLMSTFDKDTRASAREDLADVRKRIDQCVKDGKMQGFKARQLLRRLNPAGLKLSVTEDGALTGPQYDAVLKELADAEKQAPRRDGVDLSTTGVDRPALGAGDRALGEQIGDWIVKGGKIPTAK